MTRFVRLCWLLFLLTCAAAQASDKVMVHDAWIREAPPGASVMAAYMKLMNMGEEPRTLVTAKAKGFERVELHETVFDSGRATMRPVESLSVPPHGEIVLAPGGHHLMLVRPTRAFRAGSRVALELKFADGAVIQLDVPVKSALAGDTHNHHH